MAWVRCCGGSSSKKYIFKNGVLEIGMGAYPYTYTPGGSSPTNCSLSIEDNKLVLTQPSGVYGTCSFITDEIDVTNLNSITVDVSSITSIGQVRGAFTTQLSNNYTCYNVGQFYIGSGLNTFDCSNLTGMYRFAIIVITANTNAHNMKINEIRMN